MILFLSRSLYLSISFAIFDAHALKKEKINSKVTSEKCECSSCEVGVIISKLSCTFKHELCRIHICIHEHVLCAAVTFCHECQRSIERASERASANRYIRRVCSCWRAAFFVISADRRITTESLSKHATIRVRGVSPRGRDCLLAKLELIMLVRGGINYLPRRTPGKVCYFNFAPHRFYLACESRARIIFIILHRALKTYGVRNKKAVENFQTI